MWDGYVKTTLQVANLSVENSNTRALALYASDGLRQETELNNYTDQILAESARLQDEAIAHAAALGTSTTWIMIIASAVGIVLALGISIYIVRGITSNLRRIIEGLGESSSQVLAASSQISDSSQSLAEGATEQAASLEETSSALEEMASMTQQNAANAEESASAAEELSAQAGSLNSMVNDLIVLVEGGIPSEGAARDRQAGPAPRRTLRVTHVSDPVRNAPGGRPSSSEQSGGKMKMLPPSEVIPLGEDDDF